MSTKGAPGALDWVSLLPFLPLSLFHPPLPFSSDHFQHYPGTFKRLDHSFYNCATNACQHTGETNGEYYFLISEIPLPLHFLVILYSYIIMYSVSGQIIEPLPYVTQIWWVSVQLVINRYACVQLHSAKVQSFVSQCNSYNTIKRSLQRDRSFTQVN